MAWGVRLPALRALRRGVLRGKSGGALENSRPGSYEETLLRGLVIGGLNLPWEGKRPWVEDFLPRIDNWAVCDTFCNSLKPRSPEDRQEMWAFFRPLYASGQEYFARTACVVQLSHFVDQEHVEEGLALLQQVGHPGYYAKMAVAWALSVWYVKFPPGGGGAAGPTNTGPLGAEQVHPESPGIPAGGAGGKGRFAGLPAVSPPHF
mgnify:CR=1 FL=1